MSYRKTKLIQERNILLERKFIFEQEKVVTGTTVQSTGTTTTQPTGVTTPNVTTTTTVKITDSEIRNLPDCSSFNSKEFPIQSGVTKNNVTVFTYNGKNFCKKDK